MSNITEPYTLDKADTTWVAVSKLILYFLIKNVMIHIGFFLTKRFALVLYF